MKGNKEITYFYEYVNFISNMKVGNVNHYNYFGFIPNLITFFIIWMDEICFLTKIGNFVCFLIFQSGYRWSHVTNRQVCLDSTHLLLLHDFERVALQKVACKKLNAADPSVTVRIPKGKEPNSIPIKELN